MNNFRIIKSIFLLTIIFLHSSNLSAQYVEMSNGSLLYEIKLASGNGWPINFILEYNSKKNGARTLTRGWNFNTDWYRNRNTLYFGEKEICKFSLVEDGCRDQGIFFLNTDKSEILLSSGAKLKFDSFGNVVHVKSLKGDARISYTPEDRKISDISLLSAGRLLFTYSVGGKVVSIKDISGAVDLSFVYEGNALVRITNKNCIYNFKYFNDLLSKVSSQGCDGGSIEAEMEYDNYSNVVSMTQVTQSGNFDNKYTYKLGEDSLEVTWKRKSGFGIFLIMNKFQFKKGSGLRIVESRETFYNGVLVETVLYNDKGNILSYSNLSGGKKYSYDESGRLLSMKSGDRVFSYKYKPLMMLPIEITAPEGRYNITYKQDQLSEIAGADVSVGLFYTSINNSLDSVILREKSAKETCFFRMSKQTDLVLSKGTPSKTSIDVMEQLFSLVGLDFNIIIK